MQKHCCDDMRLHVCETSDHTLGEKVVCYSARFCEYGIPVAEDGGASFILISHCPWCGARLPQSKREEWFDTLEKLGYEPSLFSQDIPSEFLTDEWYRK